MNIEDKIKALLLPHQELIKDLSKFGEVALFGGAILSLLTDRPVNDIDLVVRADFLEIKKYLNRTYDTSTTYFGGSTFVYNSTEFDVWSLANTWGFEYGGVAPTSFDNLPKTVYFSNTAIAYLINAERLVHSPSYFDELEMRFVDIVCKNTPMCTSLKDKIEMYLKDSEWVKGLGFLDKIVETKPDLLSCVSSMYDF